MPGPRSSATGTKRRRRQAITTSARAPSIAQRHRRNSQWLDAMRAHRRGAATRDRRRDRGRRRDRARRLQASGDESQCAVDAEHLISGASASGVISSRRARRHRSRSGDHPHVGVQQPVPDRQQQAGDDVKLLGEFRNRGAFSFPQFREFFACGLAPVRVLEAFDAERLAAHWPDQPGADFDVAIWWRRLAASICTAARCICSLMSRQPPCARMARASASGNGGCGPCAIPGNSVSGRGVRHKCGRFPPLGDREAFGDQGLNADIVGA